MPEKFIHVFPDMTPSHRALVLGLHSSRIRSCQAGREGTGSFAFKKGDSPTSVLPGMPGPPSRGPRGSGEEGRGTRPGVP